MPGPGLDGMILGTGGQKLKVCVPEKYPGVQFRKSMNLEDKWQSFVQNGFVVQGHIEDGGEWVRLGPNVFLPTKVGALRVLQLQEHPPDASGAPGNTPLVDAATAGETVKKLRARGDRWRALANSARRDGAAQALRLRTIAESMAVDGQRWASAAKLKDLPWAGDGENAALAGEEASQAFRTWAAQAAKAKPRGLPGWWWRKIVGFGGPNPAASPPALEDATPPPSPINRRVQAEVEARVRAEAALRDAMVELRTALQRAESTETLLAASEAEVLKRESFLEGFLGREAYHVCREVLEMPENLLADIRAQRAAQRQLPAAWQELVAALTWRCRDRDRIAWEDVIFSAEASRASLAEACKDVRAAIVGEEPPAEDDLNSRTWARDELRKKHIGALAQAMDGLLASVNCTSAAALDAKVDEAKATVERVQAAVQQAADVLAADPQLGALLPALADGAQATFTEAIAAYQAYEIDCRAAAMASTAATFATDQAVESFEAMGTWEGCLNCSIHPGTWSFSSSWEGARTRSEQQAPANVSQVSEALRQIRQACEEEAIRLSDADPIRGFPLRHLLAAGGDEVDLWRLYLEATEGARDAYKALAAEVEQERSVAALLPQKLAVEGELKACEQAHADAVMAYNIAKAREDNATRKKGKPDPGLVEEVRVARRALREVDARFQAAMARLLDLPRHLPEVACLASSRVLLPPELLRFWRGCRDLSHFDERRPHKEGQVSKVHYVRDQDGLHVVKRYEIQGSDVEACLAEAALLVRLRHPHMAEVTGIFWDMSRDMSKDVFMQMPFYAEGDLANWVASKSPTQASVRKACRQVLLALEHLHSFSVVHCDVKPENIFINDLGDAFLGDFDISVDRATRCKPVQLRHTNGQAHYTQEYEAPELLRDGATLQTDMYAYGKTVANACGSSIAVKATDILDFVRRLTAEQPEKRLTAGQALEHPFFESTRFSTQVLASCAICCDDQRPLDQGVSCGSAHFVCGDCLRRHVEDELDIIETSERRREEYQERKVRIRCPQCPPPAHGMADEEEGLGSLYKDSDLGRCLPASVLDAYFLAKDKVTESPLRRERQDSLQAEVKRAREQFGLHLPGMQMQALVQAESGARRVDEAEVAAFLKRKFAGALQCPKCGLGPVKPEGTTNFKLPFSRARGSRVRDACLDCNFFSPNRRDWHAWDGHLRPRRSS